MTSTTTTAQLQLVSTGGPFKLINMPKESLPPMLKSTEILLRVTIIALNRIDAKQFASGVGIQSWPHVLGIEGAGVIEAIGSDVHDLGVGDEVAGWLGGGASSKQWGGAFQEHVVVPARYVFKKPANIGLEEAASLPICYLTAVSGIIDYLKIPLPPLKGFPAEGKVPTSILVLGGSSAVGAAAILLLRTAYPFLPILATSSTQHHKRVLGLGATAVFDYKSASMVADMTEASPEGKGVDIIFDCVSSAATQPHIFNVLDQAGSKTYAEVMTGVQTKVPEDVKCMLSSMETVFNLPGSEQLLHSLTKLVQEGKYRVPLPVRSLGHGLKNLPSVLSEVLAASGEKLVLWV